MSEKIAAEVKTVNDRINSVVEDIDKKLETLGERVSALETDLKTLKDRFERRIQSLTPVPTYSDGVERYEVTVVGGEFKKCRDLTLKFEVRPHSAAGSITREQVSANAVHTITRASAGDIKSLGIKDFSADAETGILTVTIDPSDLYKAYQENNLSSCVRITVTDPSGLYDIASGYVTVESINDPGEVSYKSANNHEFDYYELRLYDPYGNIIETLSEFSEDKFTVFSLKDASSLMLVINNHADLEQLSIHKPLKITDTGYCFFENLYELKSAELNLLDIRDVSDLGCMFCYCKKLATLDLSGWNMQSVTAMQNMFYGCANLRTITMKGCDENTVQKIEDALTEVGIRDNVTIVR